MIGTISIAGTGRVARCLGALLTGRGITISAIAGRDPSRTTDAAHFTGARDAVAIRDLPRHSQRILIAVADNAILSVATELAESGLRDSVVLHTSGAAGPDALAPLRAAGNSIGVLHPLQTIPTAEQGVQSLPGIAWAFAGDPEAASFAEALIGLLGGHPLPVDPAYWPHYHAGAVLACNYQVTLMDAALELMRTAGITRAQALDALAPIVRTTIQNVIATGPERALTGPIRRADTNTIRRHMAALQTASPETRNLYIAVGLRTIPVAGLPESAAREVAAALTSQDPQGERGAHSESSAVRQESMWAQGSGSVVRRESMGAQGGGSVVREESMGAQGGGSVVRQESM